MREEGYADGIWEERTIVPVQQVAAGVAETNERVEIGKNIFAAQNVAKDIARVHQEGFEVDNNNEPLPENVPANGNVPPANEGLYEGQSWGWDGIGYWGMQCSNFLTRMGSMWGTAMQFRV